MEEDLFNKCISSIINSVKPGYGFVNDFVQCLLSFGHDKTGISNIAVVWSYELGEGNVVEPQYFFPSTKLSLSGFYKNVLFNARRVVKSNDADVANYVSSHFIWKDNFVFIPINSQIDSKSYIQVKGGVFLLSSKDEILIDASQAEMFRLLLNSKQPSVYESACVNNYVEVFQLHTTEALPIGKRWDQVLDALSHLSGNESDDINDIHGVRYATFWKLNNLERIKEGGFYKQKECCFDRENHPKSSHESIQREQKHFINDVREFANVSNAEECPMRMYSYKEVVDSFADKNFLVASQMGESEMSAMLIPVHVNGGMGITSLDICCLYVKDMLYTPFVSKVFGKQFQGYIRRSLEDINSRAQSYMVTQLMNTYFSLRENTSFYNSAADILSRVNSMKDCLIYMRGTQDELLYIREEDVNNPRTFKNRSLQIGKKKCFLPIEYAIDMKFRNFLADYKILDENETNTATIYRGEGKESVVKSALFICIQDNTQKENSGLIILINKTHDIQRNGEHDFDVITRDNVFATYLSALYLHQFGLWNSAVSRKNYLLKKLRHEIPNCTRVIGEKMKRITSEIAERGYILSSLSSNMNTIELNRNRINILASFFAAVDYEDSRFADRTIKQDLVSLIEENMPLFKEESSSKGVDVILNREVEKRPLMISNFYPLAIVNVINNAIRYCSFASNIIITLYEDRIEISDVGLPISEMELKLIFDDGYRSSGAKEIDADGIGYGLHLARRVLNAHGSHISADSDVLGKNNFIVEAGIAQYIKSLPPVLRRRFIFDGSESTERQMIESMVKRINGELATPVEQLGEYYCKNTILLRRMIAEQAKIGGPKFVEMEDTWFMEPVAKVTFTIKFGDKILC
jgi:signal transduction histidine kinase